MTGTTTRPGTRAGKPARSGHGRVPTAPDPLPIAVVDNHTHLDIARDGEEPGDPAEALAAAAAVGVDRLVQIGCDLPGARFTVDLVERGYLLSFAGTVTFKNAAGLRDALAVTPLEHLLVETDAPYLAPAPWRGAANAPHLVPLTVRSMAGVLGVAVPTLCEALSANSERVYGPW